MSILGTLFGWITGGSSAADTVVNTGAKMLDNAFYTDQEKSADNQKLLDWYLKYQEATAPQNVARRIIAIMVISFWLLVAGSIWIGIMTGAKWIPEMQDFFKVISATSGTIVTFYFIKRFLPTGGGMPKEGDK